MAGRCLQVPAYAARWLVITALLTSTSLSLARSQPLVPLAPAAIAKAFAASKASLDRSQPARFLLHYNGPVSAFRGQLCYRFVGYNETCFDPELRWLTPATTLSFYAPGGVPVDLLAGYRLEVRAPAMFRQRFSYYVAPD